MAEIEAQRDLSKVPMSNGTDVDTAKGTIDEVIIDTVNAADGTYTEADYKRVLRKIDLWLLPLMWLCYGTQQADKVSIASQATFGLRQDTGLVGQQYSCKQLVVLSPLFHRADSSGQGYRQSSTSPTSSPKGLETM